LKDDDSLATIKNPPNQLGFEHLHSNAKPQILPLLEKCAASLRNTNTAPTIINQIHMPPEFSQRSISPVYTRDAHARDAHTSPPITAKLVEGLMGPNMDIPAFCKMYELTPDVIAHLTENGLMKTKAFQHVTLDDLKEMSFKLGEIASL
ncbi:hypothetical protein BDP27DRAFT_1201569, partial [Rhodocollybia butyracea]